ncbi:MAG TPA: superoxide dismutase family protein [Solirubrobacteraceae bacterium]|nr:superoxide dismutase family protein [Solirubrobacteraceae bacterium]
MGSKIRRTSIITTLALIACALAGGLLSGALLAQGAAPTDKRVARAALIDTTGATVGAVRFERRGKSRALRVSVTVRKLSPGFHGFHVHTVGTCEAPAFVTAGPHLNPAAGGHPAHAGDMPPLLVTTGGKAEARFTTDRFSLAQLRDADGSAVMVHALPDNQANIPQDRYDPDADAMTLATGDSGARIACGIVR